jgi:hypothetical protein
MGRYEKSDNSATGKINQQARDSVSGTLPSIAQDARPTVPRRRERLEAKRQRYQTETEEHLAKADESHTKAKEAEAQLAKPAKDAGRPPEMQDGVVGEATVNFLKRFCETSKGSKDSLEDIAKKMSPGTDTVDADVRHLRRIFKAADDHEKVAAERAGLPARNRLFFAKRWIDKKPGGR